MPTHEPSRPGSGYLAESDAAPERDSLPERDVALYARATRELAEAPTGEPLRARIWESIAADPVATRRHFPRPTAKGTWAGVVCAGLVVGAQVGILYALGLFPSQKPTFADVERAMSKVQTASWTNRIETRLGGWSRSEPFEQVTNEAWVRFGASPRLALRTYKKPSASSRGRAGASPGFPGTVSVSDGKYITRYSADRRWYARAEEGVLASESSPSFGDSPEGRLRRILVFPAPTTLYTRHDGFIHAPFFDSSMEKEPLSEWRSEWKMTEETFRGRRVLRFTCKAIRDARPSNYYVHTAVEDWTVLVDAATRRVVWRAVEGWSDHRWSYRVVSENFRYDVTPPEGIFDSPPPPVGQPYIYFDHTGSWAERHDPRRKTSPSPEEEKALRGVVNAVVGAWERRDANAFIALWDFAYSLHTAAILRPGGVLPSEIEVKRATWRAKAREGTPRITWQLSGAKIATAPANVYIRETESDPFPPDQTARRFSVRLPVRVRPENGGKPVSAQVQFWLYRRGSAYKVIGIELPRALQPDRGQEG
jgi:hypothetical protein